MCDIRIIVTLANANLCAHPPICIASGHDEKCQNSVATHHRMYQWYAASWGKHLGYMYTISIQILSRELSSPCAAIWNFTLDNSWLSSALYCNMKCNYCVLSSWNITILRWVTWKIFSLVAIKYHSASKHARMYNITGNKFVSRRAFEVQDGTAVPVSYI